MNENSMIFFFFVKGFSIDLIFLSITHLVVVLMITITIYLYLFNETIWGEREKKSRGVRRDRNLIIIIVC